MDGVIAMSRAVHLSRLAEAKARSDQRQAGVQGHRDITTHFSRLTNSWSSAISVLVNGVYIVLFFYASFGKL
jgi:hypothetical protein